MDGDWQPDRPHALRTRRRCCPMARCWSPGDTVSGTFLAARSCTIRPPGRGAATGSLAQSHATVHTATLLPNGKVLVAGGLDSSGLSNSAELYDPASGTWSSTGSLVNRTPRAHGDVAAQWQGAGRGRGTVRVTFLAARRCMIRRSETGTQPDRCRSGTQTTRPHCCRMGKFLSLGELTLVARFTRARSCTIPWPAHGARLDPLR